MRVLIFLLLVPLAGAPAQPLMRDFVFTKGLIIRSAPGFPDNIAGKDPIEGQLVKGTWRLPDAGDRVKYNDTLTAVWEEVQGDSAGWFDHPLLAGAYLYFELTVLQQQAMILLPMGSSMSYVNGIPRAGNPYGLKETYERWEPPFDYTLLPVELQPGKNWFLFPCTRGRFKARLFAPPAGVFLNARDCTLPDVAEAAPYDGFGAIVVVNATAKALKGLQIESLLAGCGAPQEHVPVIQPMSVRKVRFPIQCRSGLAAGTLPMAVHLLAEGKLLDSATLNMRVVRHGDAYRATFLSGIDGSVQYYAVLPASGEPGREGAAMVFSLHGAGVDALNQAASYEAKSWAHIVCPTNRRPYGFNWEDWGRTDALEVLDEVRGRLRIDESRIYLTGHSMGGHGAFHLGSLFPDQFAAIGPSAGWISFWTYRVRERFENPSAMRQMLMRPALASDTYTFARNYPGVYILHGSNDDNVPVEQSRAMARHLGTFHRDYVYHEESGVGHWWDRSDEPGADCVDWAPMFDFFSRHARPIEVREIHFATPSPGISSRCYWASVDAQTEQWKLSRLDLRVDPGKRRIVGNTENIRRMSVRLSSLPGTGPVGVNVDSQTISGIPWPPDGTLHLERAGEVWRVTGIPPGNLKSPERYGAFRDAIRNNVVFVYGTMGSAEENLWAFAKARFDAERFWYQGNGSIEVLADTECTLTALQERNVVLYGNAGTHRLWARLLEDSPVQVAAGRVSVGGRIFRGKEIACVFIRPKGDRFSLGVVSGTGLAGMRATNRMPYLLPGIGFPDFLLSRASSYDTGEEALLGAGFFGDDWSVEKGEFVWWEE